MMTNVRSLQAVRAARRIPWRVVLPVAAGWAIAAAAQLRIPVPWSPVPITGQTLAVAIIGVLLGPRRALAAVMLYLAQGAMGLPFFAGHSAGLAVLGEATGGYLIAMPFGAAVAGMIARDRTSGFVRLCAACLASSAIILLAGTVWMVVYSHGLFAGVFMGLLPFLPGEILKAIVAAGLLRSRRTWR